MQSNNDTRHIDEIEHQFNSICRNTFHRTPYQWQPGIGSTLLRAYHNKIMMRLLLVRPTGGGKTLVFNNTITACLKGVTLCISSPLLVSLGANQTRKVMESAHDDRSIASFHLDETSPQSIKELLSSIKVLPTDKTVLFILFTSPQAIVNRNDKLRDYLISNKLKRFIAVDEIHLVNNVGKTFRSEFGALKEKLFAHLKKEIPMMFITATCTTDIRVSFQNLLDVDITQQHWPAPSKMATRQISTRQIISFNLTYSTQPLRFVNNKKTIKGILMPDLG